MYIARCFICARSARDVIRVRKRISRRGFSREYALGLDLPDVHYNGSGKLIQLGPFAVVQRN